MGRIALLLLLAACDAPRTAPAAPSASASAAPSAPAPTIAPPAVSDAPRDRELAPEAAALQKVVHRDWGKLARCYQEGLKRDPKLGGRLTLYFTVGVDGRPEKIEARARPVVSNKPENVRQAFPDRKVAECITDVVAAMRFAKRAEPAPVAYPIDFSSE